MLRSKFIALCVGVLAAFAAGSAMAADANMFQGKTITYIVATDAGGIYDAYGRLVARFLQEKLPGSRIIVRNVPGAGHLVGANMLNASRPDGLTIGTFNTGLIYDQLLGREGLRFDLSKMTYIAKGTIDTRALVLSVNSGFKNIDGFIAAPSPPKLASSGIGSASYIETKILEDTLQTPLAIVPGFNGTEGELSMLRGEVVGTVGTASSLQPFVDAGHGFIALVLSDSDDYPGIARAADYAKTDRARQLLSLVTTLSQIGRLIAGPPDIPPETVTVLREGVMAAMADPEFIAEAERLGLPFAPTSGEAVEAMVHEALAQPPEMIAYLRSAAGE